MKDDGWQVTFHMYSGDYVYIVKHLANPKEAIDYAYAKQQKKNVNMLYCSGIEVKQVNFPEEQ